MCRLGVGFLQEPALLRRTDKVDCRDERARLDVGGTAASKSVGWSWKSCAAATEYSHEAIVLPTAPSWSAVGIVTSTILAPRERSVSSAALKAERTSGWPTET